MLSFKEHLYIGNIENLVRIKIILNMDPALNNVIAQNANFLAEERVVRNISEVRLMSRPAKTTAAYKSKQREYVVIYL